MIRRRKFLGVLAGMALVAACGKVARLQAIAPGQVVLAFGDSVTYGTGAAPGEDWPALLAALTGWQVINAGIPGDTAEAGKGRIKALLEEHRPALVIIEMGGNDFLRRRPANAIKEDLRLIVRLARDAGSQVVLIGVPELSLLAVVAGKPSDSPIFRALAEEEKISLVSDVFSDVLARPELCADRIHPNAEGYRRMAAGIHAQLQRIGLN
jgi:acyl-CoA thioesterase I